MTPDQLRALVRLYTKTEISSVQAEKVLEIFHDDLEAHLNEAKKEFVLKHFLPLS